ncbi:Mannosyl-oligosaccharide 1-2-alpha-mannosidase [Penicillium verhagenii]|uniref:Mannosyl-oligosaccharide 1-2-alpha-mannosidase n=1 Tax=Penicillium verhagenii TaxID=1562060 RepID=UPI002544D76F|nr:Mannosyl-oligosaccharide 1-2-alpha-mannosidase [Penicillium verhagenii]KAJ5918618.1 Mannosyl-oligosaccharide 1-2-alpha-mannosidase [Penicillium verhagenii]
MPSTHPKQPKYRHRHSVPWPIWFASKRVVSTLLIGGLVFGVGTHIYTPSTETVLDYFRPTDQDSYWDSHREEVKKAFTTSWNAYAKYSWGADVFHPVSKTGGQMSPSGLGWIIVDSLDTLMIMNLTTQLSDARKWLNRDLSYDQNQDVNTFETTIRMLGGLLSAHYLSTLLPDVSSRRDYIYKAKAVDLADRLLSAYDTRTGIPYASVNIGTRQGLPSHTDGGASSTAEAGTLQLEMKYLAQLTGREVYWRKAEHIMKVLDDHRMQDGLLPIFVNPQTGSFPYQEIRLGSRGDSYYEYLVKQYLQTYGEETIYSDMWEEALAGIQKQLVITTKHSHLRIIAELPSGIGGKLSPKMDHLVCFLPGSIAIGATEGRTEAEARKLPSWTPQREKQMELARELMKSCWAMYAVTESGLAPEISWFEADPDELKPSSRSSHQSWPRSSNEKESWKEDFIIKPADAHNLQRPETVESLFLMFRVTNDPIYRKWGWEIFKAFQKHTLVPDGEGYTSLHDVTESTPRQRDNMESFWLAETLKYLYLLFSPREFLPLTEVVFNTEAHVLPRFKPKFQTGWTRKKRS